MTYNFNVSPYWDDFDEAKKFLRVLFRPGVAVQARELTQLQTILQNQVSRLGNHLFEEGSMVIPGSLSFDDKANYVKLQNLNASSQDISTFLSEFEGKTIVGQTSGVKAVVIKATLSAGADPHTLHVKYIDSGTATTNKTFTDNESILSVATTPRSARLLSSNATGVGSIASIEAGIYYIYGYFALVDSQSIILDKYATEPSYRVGLRATEIIVTSAEDATLNDNAQGSFNYAAPGAHRYKIELALEKLSLDSVLDDSFIELLRVNNGVIEYRVVRTEYSELETTLARRTYDESGNYTVRPFNISVKEYRNNDRGQWVSGRSYLTGDIVSNASNYYTAQNNGVSGADEPVHTPAGTVGNVSDGTVVWSLTPKPEYNQGVFTPATTLTVSENAVLEAQLAIGLEPGKAYVQGYEIEKVSTTYIPVDKARDFARVSDTKTAATVGNYILVNNIFSVPEVIQQFPVVELRNQITATGGTAAGSVVGTARIRGMEKHEGTTYKLFLFDISMTSGKTLERDVKQVFYNNSGIFDFTADIANVPFQLSGSITSYTTSDRTTQGSGIYIRGVGTKFTSELVVGDYIAVGTSLVRVTVITDNNNITVGTAINQIGVFYSRVQTAILETGNQTLIFPLSQYAIRKIRGELDGSDYGTSYTVFNNFGTRTSDGSGIFSIPLTTTGESFSSPDLSSNYLVVKNTTGVIASPSITRSLDNTQATFSGLENSTAYTVVAAVNKATSAAKEKVKTLVPSAFKDFTTSATATLTTLSLEKADIYKIRSIEMASAFGTFVYAGSIDITDRYILDNGQRSTHYGVGSLILKPGQSVPTGTLRVKFDYFTHGTGDYFSVDSYSIPYEDIPEILRDSFDFRPRMDDTGANYTGSGASLTSLPKRGIDIEADYSYFLSRKDKICIDIDGNFFNIEGIAAEEPTDPTDPRLGMVLHKIYLEPFTFDTTSNNVEIETLNNKRYTMRDIGSLEKRIENVEYYTALSLLEQETKSLTIIDDLGLDRFKNGFIVDDFSGQGVGDVLSGDYICSIDMENNELRPFFTMNNVNLVEENTTDTQRDGDYYALTGDLITLPYTHVEAIKQPYASRTENVNPFAIFTFIGNTQLNPPSDDWFETSRRPDIIINQEGNFNAVATLAEASGALGTVWNAWQTQWTGTSVVTSTNTVRHKQKIKYRKIRDITTQQLATEVGQSRTGVTTSLIAKIDTQQIDDRTLSTAVIPFIRSRNVLFTARGLKPTTKFFPFFDNIAISQYITPATQITITAVSGFVTDFDFTTNVGGVSPDAARLIDENTDTALNKGDVITGLTSNATAIVAYREINSSGVIKLHVVNVKGTFQSGEIIEGSLSGARGSISVAVVPASLGGDLVTNFSGDVIGLFNIPNTDALRFRTGVREFRLSDSNLNDNTATSTSSQQYRAQGILETKQATIVATRNAEFVQSTVSDNRTIIETSSRVIRDTGWHDPLAQTFMIQQSGGLFLTKVDLFFATRDEANNIPMRIEIREVVNGYPGKKIVPFSTVIKSWDQIVTSEDASVATTFVFNSPVYLQDATEYCLVLLSDSNNYNVWISQLGELNIGTDRFISEQPYAGVLFKSQNASTWTADQLQDLKFTLYRAQFDINLPNDSVVTFVNDQLTIDLLDPNPLKLTNTSNKIRVFHRNHGMSNGSTVTISGLATATYNNIPSTEINASHIISDADFDSYIITVTTSANATGFIGENTIKASKDIRFDSIQPIIQSQVFGETNISAQIITTDTGYNLDSTGSAVILNETSQLTTPRIVASKTNETAQSIGKSLKLVATLSSTNDSISPIIDIQRASAILVGNRINSPTQSLNVAVVDDRVLISSTNLFAIDETNNRFTTVYSNVKEIFKTISVGKYIVLSGLTLNNGTFLVTEVANDGSYIGVQQDLVTESVSGATLTLKDKYVDEIAPVNSSSSSKYVTKTIQLKNPSTFFKILFAYNKPQAADIEVYYKTVAVGSTTPTDKINYTRILPDAGTLVSEVNPNVFTDAEYSLANLEQFGSIVVKVVLKSTNTAMVPRLQDFRVIACA